MYLICIAGLMWAQINCHDEKKIWLTAVLLLISGMMAHVQAGSAIWITQAELDRLPMGDDVWDNIYTAVQNRSWNMLHKGST